jgi:NAD(P)-dependent dehydrogenase (short-subunit alcohol dehydrogenase family)
MILKRNVSRFYAASKYAVTGLLEGWRQEMREQKNNIRISALSPGNTKAKGALDIYPHG